MPKPIISDVLIDDLLTEADPKLEDQPEALLKALRALLRPLLNQVVKACRTPADLPAVVARMRIKASATKTTAQAFNLFIQNIADTGDLAIA